MSYLSAIRRIFRSCIVPFLVFVAVVFFTACTSKQEIYEPADYVNPFVGTDAHGHTYPGATVPFGMVQLSPDTRLGGWDGASGYHFTDSVIYGFTHTALNGTGVGDYGDILLMPQVGEPAFANEEYRSPFQKINEYAEPGYYRVVLDKPGVEAELTATARVGYHRYTFPKSEQANIIIDLEHRDKVVESWIEFVSDTEIRGMRRSTNWAKDMVWYFHMTFSKPFVRKGIRIGDRLVSDSLFAEGRQLKAFVGFNTQQDEPIEVKVALSPVDGYGALNNMNTEVPEWNFQAVRQHSKTLWNNELKRLAVDGGTNEQKSTFYTAMYHSFLQPNRFFDVDRRYRGMDKKVHVAENFDVYTVFSLWDTYRTWHPLMTILDTARTLNFINTMLDMYDKGGLLPIWELAANETYCMIGNHAISVIADAYMKGLRDFDSEKAMEAMLHSATRDHFGLDAYRAHGHIPGDMEHESISKTLEYAYNDWNIAVMARQMGKTDVYKEYIHRAQFYKNIFDPTSGFMRPRLNGGWLEPFDPTVVDWHFTEANSWQYSFYVPHDISGLAQLHGGKAQLANKIDEMFTTEFDIGGRDMKDITGLIGQYAHGNEPSHHVAYMYNYLNEPWKTQQRVAYIRDHFYSAEPDGRIGNEDCGQMSAWYIMSAMGFYPVAPGIPQYAIGTPLFPKMTIHLQNGKKFSVTANGVSPEHFYIQSATLNGKSLTRSWISHSEIMAGGKLHFEMGNEPNKEWASTDADVPVTEITDEPLLPVPQIISEGRRIRDVTEVKMSTTMNGSDIYFTLDGSEPSTASQLYTKPVELRKTVTLKAVAYDSTLGYSFPLEARFVKIDVNKTVDIATPYDKNYHAGGPEGLIDGLRGAENWRLGGWQGYQGTDFEATVDLGSRKPIQFLEAGFVQDIRSWIWMPTDVTFFVSDDGKNFRNVGQIKNTIPTDDYSIQHHDLGIKLKNTTTRYVKVKATNFGTIPNWHLGAGGEAYIFIDEIIIR
jgi:predicted alpha-1,2-mannosidase